MQLDAAVIILIISDLCFFFAGLGSMITERRGDKVRLQLFPIVATQFFGYVKALIKQYLLKLLF